MPGIVRFPSLILGRQLTSRNVFLFDAAAETLPCNSKAVKHLLVQQATNQELTLPEKSIQCTDVKRPACLVREEVVDLESVRTERRQINDRHTCASEASSTQIPIKRTKSPWSRPLLSIGLK